jgi:Protein of unknown function (DUF3306)
MSAADGDGFLARWSRRKAQVRQGDAASEPADAIASPVLQPAAPVPAVTAPPAQLVQPVAEERPPAPTLDDVAQLSRTSDFRRFVAADVEPEVKNAALKKLFADPQFNVMDGLDTYIDDYGKPDPIPASMLRQMVQSHALGLFADEDKETEHKKPPAPAEAGATPDGVAPVDAAQSSTESSDPVADDQDASLRLQPLDAAGPTGAEGGAGQDARRER